MAIKYVGNVNEVRSLYAKGYSVAKIAEMTGLSEFSVTRILFPNR